VGTAQAIARRFRNLVALFGDAHDQEAAMIKVKASITLDFDAPDGSDVWALVRNATTSAAMALTDWSGEAS
jgi:hypothetical protein